MAIGAPEDRLPVVHLGVGVLLSQRVLRFYKKGHLLLHTPAAIGSTATPTPLGRYYVNQRLIPSDPGGPFGPGAIGIVIAQVSALAESLSSQPKTGSLEKARGRARRQREAFAHRTPEEVIA